VNDFSIHDFVILLIKNAFFLDLIQKSNLAWQLHPMEAMNRMIQNNIFDLDTFFPIWKI
jgi:hypothetical protein